MEGTSECVCVRVDVTVWLRMVNKVFCHIWGFIFVGFSWRLFGCMLNDRIPSRWASVLRGGICDDPANPAHGQMGILVLSLSLLRCAWLAGGYKGYDSNMAVSLSSSRRLCFRCVLFVAPILIHTTFWVIPLHWLTPHVFNVHFFTIPLLLVCVKLLLFIKFTSYYWNRAWSPHLCCVPWAGT